MLGRSRMAKNVQYHKILTYFLYGPFFQKPDILDSSLMTGISQGDYCFGREIIFRWTKWAPKVTGQRTTSQNGGHCTLSLVLGQSSHRCQSTTSICLQIWYQYEKWRMPRHKLMAVVAVASGRTVRIPGIRYRSPVIYDVYYVFRTTFNNQPPHTEGHLEWL